MAHIDIDGDREVPSPSFAPVALVFGGTTEGRMLIEWLADHALDVYACSATEYGGSLLPDNAHVFSSITRLTCEEMKTLMQAYPFQCVIDATHPYASFVSQNIVEAAAATGLPYLRIVRDQHAYESLPVVASAQDAARVISEREGNVLLTTGSKDLALYAHTVPHFEERLYARILPVMDSLENALNLGYPVDHVIAMQGPFTYALNKALIEMLNIDIVVTKDSGSTGGFLEKVEAAQACGVQLLVIGRPLQEEGFTLQELKEDLLKRINL